jgi:hypothetical protein
VENPLLGAHPTELRIACRFREFARAVRNPDQIADPVYGELVLDAIASERTDPRRTILFAAFAVEQAFSTELDREYEKARRERRTGWRWVPAGESDSDLPVDPVFEKLRVSARSSWRTLSVELPLYAWGRSLLHDERSLYDWIFRLRRVRNALTHVGPSPPDEKDLTIDATGAHLALRIAELAFSWLPVRNYFWALPRQDEDFDLDEALAELTFDPSGDGVAD